jgi:hypothetical protein
MLGDLGPPPAMAVQRGDRALALGQPLKHSARHPLDLRLILAVDQLVLRRACRAGHTLMLDR